MWAIVDAWAPLALVLILAMLTLAALFRLAHRCDLKE